MSFCALLISEDNTTLSVLRLILGEMDIAIEECHDSAAAKRKFAAQRYEVVVIDLPEQPELQELLQALRQSSPSGNALAICVLDVQTNVRAIFAAGANLVFYRPLIAERVRASIRAAGHLIRREKRRSPRLLVHSDATISYPAVESAPATLVDLSEEGLAIQCAQQLPTKSKIYFRFALPGQTKVIQLSGETMWQDSTGRAGIRFADVPQSARRILKDWVNSKSAAKQSKVTIDLPVGRPGPLPNSPNDRRGESRHACQLGAEVYRSGSSVPHRCTLTDISPGGCYVEMPSPFETGAGVEIVVRTHQFKFQSHGVVQVVNRGFGMGVEFSTQTSQQREQVQQLIKMVFAARTLDADPILRF